MTSTLDAGVATPRPPHAVVLVHNTLVSYSRAVRFARSLASAGWSVTLAGLAADGLPASERLAVDPGRPDGPTIELVRIAPGGPFAPFIRWRDNPVERLLRRLHLPTPRAVVEVLAWPLLARAWTHGLRTLPPADLYHACGVWAAAAALQLKARSQATGRAGRVVYDLIDIFIEANRYAFLPAWRRWIVRRREARLVASADLLTTVNDALAADAVTRWRLAESPLVLYNCPSRNEMPEGPTQHIREATGIPVERAIVAFLGRLAPHRGLLEAGDAVLRVPDACFVAIGHGPLEAELRARDRDPASAGRHFTLPPVAPEDVASWAASADATIFVARGTTLNLRLSTPNKLWESLAGGTPIVVGEELTAMREIVEPPGLGIAARHDDPEAIASAVRRLLGVPDAERAARRERAQSLLATRYAWDVRVPAYLAAVERLVGRAPSGP